MSDRDVAMPEYSPVRICLPKEPLDHISEERSSQMRSFESSRRESDGKRDSLESNGRKSQRRSAGDSLEKQRKIHGQNDPEKREDKEFLDSASDVSDLPALPSNATYARHRLAHANVAAVPSCLMSSSETPKSNRSSCTMEAVDALEGEPLRTGSEMMNSYLKQERKNSLDKNSSMNSVHGGSSVGPVCDANWARLNRSWTEGADV